MGRKAKLLARLQQRPRDFTWDELTTLLKAFGYKQAKPGKIGGSRRRFVHPKAAYRADHHCWRIETAHLYKQSNNMSCRNAIPTFVETEFLVCRHHGYPVHRKSAYQAG